MFKLFAELIAFHLDAKPRVATSAATLSREREELGCGNSSSPWLGHDLRNPLHGDFLRRR